MTDFSDRVALVTGSTRGIGLQTAKSLALAGATVIVNGTKPETVEEAVQQIQELGAEAVGIPADAASPDEIRGLYRDVFKRFKRLDILVNNAGIMRDARLGMIPDDLIDATLATNVAGSIHYLQGAAKLMQRAKSGAIVNLSSVVGIHGAVGQSVYCASKAAIIGLTKAAAKELAPLGIRVNAVAPGFIDTDLVADVPVEETVERIPVGRMGTPAEVAEAIKFLVSDESKYITGQVLGVDGAMTP